VAAGLADRGADGGVADVLEGVDRDLLSLQVGGRLDGVVPGHDAAVVGLVLAGGGNPVGDDLEGQPPRLGDQQRGDVAEPELELAADHAGDDRRPALARLQGQLDAPLGEEALLLAQVDGGDVEDRDDPDLDLGGAAPGRLTAVVVAGGAAAGGGEQRQDQQGDEGSTHAGLRSARPPRSFHA
jgi:hypothetical protein